MMMNASAIFVLGIALFCFSSQSRAENVKHSLGPAFDFTQFPSVVLIVGLGKGNEVQHICTGTILNTEGKATHILTSAYCIQNKTDPTDLTKKLSFHVLVPDANGTTQLGSSKFSAFQPLERIIYPGAGTNANFTFDTVLSDGTPTRINGTIDQNDVGIIRLQQLLNVTGLQPVSLSAVVPPNASRVDLIGFGGPDYYSLRKSDAFAVIPSYQIEGNSAVPNESLLFFRDVINPSNVSQAIEAGDEGGPIVIPGPGGNGWVQVAIAQGTWRVSEDGVTAITYASLGPLIGPFISWINETINADFVVPTDGSSAGSSSSVAWLTCLVLIFSYFL